MYQRALKALTLYFKYGKTVLNSKRVMSLKYTVIAHTEFFLQLSSFPVWSLK